MRNRNLSALIALALIQTAHRPMLTRDLANETKPNAPAYPNGAKAARKAQIKRNGGKR